MNEIISTGSGPKIKLWRKEADGSYSPYEPLAARLSNPESERPPGPALERPAPGEGQGSPRLEVRVERRSRKLLDADNLGGAKFCVDRLRYEGLIPNDDPGSIELKLSQRKVKTKAEEGTMITITDCAKGQERVEVGL